MRRAHQGETAVRVRFKAEVERWAGRLKVRPTQIRIQRMTRKWASCSPRGRVSFNSELPIKSRRIREIIIVHELLHLKVPNHGKLFKSLLRAYLPGCGRHLFAENCPGRHVARNARLP